MAEDKLKEQAWSVTDIKAYLVIKWDGLLGPNSNISLPTWVLTVLKAAFPSAGEGIIVDIIQCSVDYALNDIPNCQAQIAMGRRADDVKIVAAIHYLINSLKLFVPASVYMEAEVTSSNGIVDDWPEGPFRIFDGYITGTGYRKTSTGVEFNLSMIHWLSDLNFSSCASRSSSPGNPSQISFDPTLPVYPTAGALAPIYFNALTGMTQVQPLITNGLLAGDLWGKAIQSLFVELSKHDRINWQQLSGSATNCGFTPKTTEKRNIEALAALQKIEPLPNGYEDGVPLKIKSFPGQADMFDRIAFAIGNEQPEMLFTHTFWDKLVGQYAQDFLFMLVPQVEKAFVAPFIPGLRTPWLTVYASDYDYIESTMNIPRPLRGVMFMVGQGQDAGGQFNFSAVHNLPGAYYENPKRLNGLVIFKRAPRWLSTVPLKSNYNSQGQAIDIATGDAGQIVHPGVPGATPLDTGLSAKISGSLRTPKGARTDIETLWCSFARAMYVQEVLRGRQGKISGKLRWDIAPGSIIRIEEPLDEFVKAQLGGRTSYQYAMVTRVSTYLNSEAQKAGTAIQFAFTRSTDENMDDAYSTPDHPVWKCRVFGAPLVNHPAFYPKGYPDNYPKPTCD